MVSFAAGPLFGLNSAGLIVNGVRSALLIGAALFTGIVVGGGLSAVVFIDAVFTGMLIIGIPPLTHPVSHKPFKVAWSEPIDGQMFVVVLLGAAGILMALNEFGFVE
jgi:hypothetical protein